MKRIIYFLLAMLTIFLATIPCQDEVTYANENIQLSEQRVQSFDASPLRHTDQCSPFCMCSCCAHITSVYEPALELISEPSLFFDSKVIFTYHGKIPVSAPIAIWQPPQSFI
jgi:hypothetical protein